MYYRERQMCKRIIEGALLVYVQAPGKAPARGLGGRWRPCK